MAEVSASEWHQKSLIRIQYIATLQDHPTSNLKLLQHVHVSKDRSLNMPFYKHSEVGKTWIIK